MAADGTSSSMAMSARTSDRTVNTRAPAPVNASAMQCNQKLIFANED